MRPDVIVVISPERQLSPGSTGKVSIPSPTMLHFRGGRAGISRQHYPELDPEFYEDVAKAFSVSNFLFTDVEGNSLVSITISSLSLASGDTLKLNGANVTVNEPGVCSA